MLCGTSSGDAAPSGRAPGAMIVGSVCTATILTAGPRGDFSHTLCLLGYSGLRQEDRMLDVHPPHTRMEGFRDFLLHLLTITIGLLIALGLEGCVEWQYHRHLVREANDGLRAEIAQNIKTLDSMRQPIKDQQKEMDDDLKTLAEMRAHPGAKGNALSFGFAIHSFDQTAWKTAQTTGAFAYMPYDDASRYADIYGGQEQFVQVEQQVVEATLQAAAIPASEPDDWRPAPAQIDEMIDRTQIAKMRLYFLSGLLDGLDKVYHKV